MKKTFYQRIINLIFCQQFLFESFFEKKLVKSPFFPSPGKYQPILVSRAWNTHLASLLSLTMCCIWTPSASRFICAWVQFSTCKINSALGEPKPTNSDQTKYFSAPKPKQSMKTRCKTQSPQSAHAAAGMLGVCGHVLCSSLKEEISWHLITPQLGLQDTKEKKTFAIVFYF